MPKLNIPRSVNDPTYRYKRDKIEIVIQNTNGGITKLLNIDKIALQLGCEVNGKTFKLRETGKAISTKFM